jgi:hypothetical protein
MPIKAKSGVGVANANMRRAVGGLLGKPIATKKIGDELRL